MELKCVCKGSVAMGRIGAHGDEVCTLKVLIVDHIKQEAWMR